MATAYGSVGTGSAEIGTSFNIAKPSSTASGDILVAWLTLDSGTATSLTLTGGSTWNLLASGGDGSISSRIYWKVAGGSEPASNYTAGKNSGESASGIIVRVTEGSTSAPTFATNFTGQFSTSISSPSLIAPGDADVLIRFASGLTGTFSSTWTAPGSHTERADLQDGGLWLTTTAATRTLAASGATGTANFTATRSLASGISAAVAITKASFPQTIIPSGIASSEAFGTSQFNLSISPSGIATGEAFGDLIISTPQPQSISPSGIASGEAFGTLTTGLYLGPSGIASGEAWGSVRLAALIGPAGIPSAEAFGTTNLGVEQFLALTGIVSGETFGDATLQLGYPQTIEPVGIESGELVEDPTIRNLSHLVLVNPSIQETPAAWDRLNVRFGLHRGITIMQDASGVWSTVRYPAQTEIETAQAVYMGGHRHVLTVDEADALILAGYGSYIHLETIT